MQYEEALQRWGARKIADSYGLLVEDIDLSSVKVEFSFNEGNPCCGGRDPGCYCSFYESPSADVVMTANGFPGQWERVPSYRYTQNALDFDFATLIRELCEISGAAITT